MTEHIHTALLILGLLAAFWSGAWLTWRCLRPEPLLIKAVPKDLPTDVRENEDAADEQDELDEEEPSGSILADYEPVETLLDRELR